MTTSEDEAFRQEVFPLSSAEREYVSDIALRLYRLCQTARSEGCTSQGMYSKMGTLSSSQNAVLQGEETPSTDTNNNNNNNNNNNMEHPMTISHEITDNATKGLGRIELSSAQRRLDSNLLDKAVSTFDLTIQEVEQFRNLCEGMSFNDSAAANWRASARKIYNDYYDLLDCLVENKVTIAKKFDDRWYTGELRSIEPLVENPKKKCLGFRIVYEDDDEEDMYLDEFIEALKQKDCNAAKNLQEKYDAVLAVGHDATERRQERLEERNLRLEQSRKLQAKLRGSMEYCETLKFPREIANVLHDKGNSALALIEETKDFLELEKKTLKFAFNVPGSYSGTKRRQKAHERRVTTSDAAHSPNGIDSSEDGGGIEKRSAKKRRSIGETCTGSNSPNIVERKNGEFVVDSLLKYDIRDGEEKILVRWKGYTQNADTWEPINKFGKFWKTKLHALKCQAHQNPNILKKLDSLGKVNKKLLPDRINPQKIATRLGDPDAETNGLQHFGSGDDELIVLPQPVEKLINKSSVVVQASPMKGRKGDSGPVADRQKKPGASGCLDQSRQKPKVATQVQSDQSHPAVQRSPIRTKKEIRPRTAVVAAPRSPLVSLPPVSQSCMTNSRYGGDIVSNVAASSKLQPEKKMRSFAGHQDGFNEFGLVDYQLGNHRFRDGDNTDLWSWWLKVEIEIDRKQQKEANQTMRHKANTLSAIETKENFSPKLVRLTDLKSDMSGLILATFGGKAVSSFEKMRFEGLIWFDFVALVHGECLPKLNHKTSVFGKATTLTVWVCIALFAEDQNMYSLIWGRFLNNAAKNVEGCELFDVYARDTLNKASLPVVADLVSHKKKTNFCRDRPFFHVQAIHLDSAAEKFDWMCPLPERLRLKLTSLSLKKVYRPCAWLVVLLSQSLENHSQKTSQYAVLVNGTVAAGETFFRSTSYPSEVIEAEKRLPHQDKKWLSGIFIPTPAEAGVIQLPNVCSATDEILGNRTPGGVKTFPFSYLNEKISPEFERLLLSMD